MPAFLDPFPGRVPDRPLTVGEIVRALRLDIASELEATHLYTAQAEAINPVDDPKIVRMLIDIADEERIHAGEFLRLIEALDGRETELIQKGREEVENKTGFPKISYEPMTARR